MGALALVALTLSACSDDSGSAQPGATVSATEPTQSASPSPSNDLTPVPAPTASIPVVDQVSQDGLFRLQTVKWSSYDVVGENQIRLHYALGSPGCNGTFTDVSETDTEVRVTLQTGSKTEEFQPCTADLMAATTLITTEQPIGDRKIVPAS